MKESLQYKRTDKAIVHAFITLCKKKSFDRLTVKDILEEAIVSRNTFYTHYKDKYEIAEMLFTQFIESFQENLDDIYKTNRASIYRLPDEKRNREILHRHQVIYEESKDVINVLLKIHTDQVDLLGAMEHYFFEKYQNDVQPSEKETNSSDRDYFMESKIYASIELAAVKSGFSSSTSIPYFAPEALSQNIINASLFAVGIRTPQIQKELCDIIMERRREVMTSHDIP